MLVPLLANADHTSAPYRLFLDDEDIRFLDGVNTEVAEGLKEGDQVVIGLMAPSSSSSGQRPPSNPFGGGGFRRF